MRYDVVVIGGGSGGFGAALAAARLGLTVGLVEKGDCLGGTAVRAGVNCWETGAGGTGIAFELYKRLKKMPNAIGIYSYGRHGAWFRPEQEAYPFPGGEQLIDPNRRYLDTLMRHGSKGMAADEAYCREKWHGLPFEPQPMAAAMREMLEETANCDVRPNTAFTDVRTQDGRVTSLTLDDGCELSAEIYIDATGDALLCAAAGCESMTGQEGHARFGEPSAPEEPNQRVNGVTLIYRVTPADEPRIQPLPDNVPAGCWWADSFPGVCLNQYPGGDLNLNMLPAMEGAEFMRLGNSAAYDECRRRVPAHWHWLQSDYGEFRSFRLKWLAPVLGVRESRRIVGEYVLSEDDLRAGLSGQEHNDIICIADHALDTHGGSARRAGCVEFSEPYGVPFRCLIPKGFDNLLIACRGASFSSLAASSCRLSRTMMQLGQAAGTAAWLASRSRPPGGTSATRSLPLPEVPAAALREALREQHVQLAWPIPDGLAAYLSEEDSP